MAGWSRADMVKDLGVIRIGAIRIYGDGSVYHLNLEELDISAIPVMREDSVCCKDFTYDEPRDLILRIYKPISTTGTSSDVHKLPIIVYLHGGGFCVGPREWPTCHNGCLHLTSSTGAVVIAPDFRLSPEHRVPAIFDNVVRAVRWIGGQAGDEWLSEVEGGRVEIDLERVFVVGDSSGGTVTHHLAVRLGSRSLNLDPIDVKGYVLISPFIGGVAQTRSEKDSTEPWLNLELPDWFWKMALPDGATRDDPWANPFDPLSPDLEAAALRCILVIAGGNEIMKDRIEDHVKRLAEMGKAAEYKVFDGQYHDFFLNDSYPETGGEVARAIKHFIFETCT